MNIRHILSSFLLLTLSATVSAQRMDSLLLNYSSKYPQEKLYLQFDKNYYNPGETIWFKAYLFSDMQPSPLSKNLYFELIDEKGNVLNKRTAPVLESSAAGSFDIAANFKQPFVYLRAYTRWMLNFDTTFIYCKPIRILNNTTATTKTPAENKGAARKAPANNATVAGKALPEPQFLLRFFPEGGDMVTGLRCNIAFNAITSGGYPTTVKGTIVNSKSQPIISFASEHDGMGSFTLVPQTGETYTAIWKDKAGKEQRTPLPAAKTSGALLSVQDGLMEKLFSVRAAVQPDDNANRYHLVVHMFGQAIYMANLRIRDTTPVIGRIPSEQLPSGIMQFTLFNSNWQPVAERVSFIDNIDYVATPEVEPVNKDLAKRKKNVIDIRIPDTLKTNLSIAITDANLYTPAPYDDNIISGLLLTSELRGAVHNPYYYFDNSGDSIKRHLDLVMLTHGWRRYNWDVISSKQFPPLKYPLDGYLSLIGQVTGMSASQAKKIGTLNLILQAPDSSKQMLFLSIDSTGKFRQDGLLFFGKVNIYYQFNKNKGLIDRVDLTIDNGLWKGYNLISLNTENFAAANAPDSLVIKNNNAVTQDMLKAMAQRDKKEKMLEEVVVKAKVKSEKEKMDERYTSGMFRGGDGYSFDVANDPFAQGSQSVFNYLQGRVAGLQINTNGGEPTLSWRGGSPGLYLDEMSVDASMLQSMSMSDVAYIKVFRPPFMGFGGGNGGIAVYTKRGGGVTVGNIRGLEAASLMGYTAMKEFYSPDYSTYLPAHDVDDIRTTLLWEPYILLDKSNRKTSVTFYNNDITKRFRVVVEGVTETGKLVRVEKIIQ